MERGRDGQALLRQRGLGEQCGKGKAQGESVKGKVSKKGGSVENNGRDQAEAGKDGNSQPHKLDQWYFTGKREQSELSAH